MLNLSPHLLISKQWRGLGYLVVKIPVMPPRHSPHLAHCTACPILGSSLCPLFPLVRNMSRPDVPSEVSVPGSASSMAPCPDSQTRRPRVPGGELRSGRQDIEKSWERRRYPWWPRPSCLHSSFRITYVHTHTSSQALLGPHKIISPRRTRTPSPY